MGNCLLDFSSPNGFNYFPEDHLSIYWLINANRKGEANQPNIFLFHKRKSATLFITTTKQRN